MFEGHVRPTQMNCSTIVSVKGLPIAFTFSIGNLSPDGSFESFSAFAIGSSLR